MGTTIKVPLNTMLADLDETVRRLLRREFTGRGFDGIEIAFDAPSKEWSAQLSSPTVNLFLYDVRQSEDHRPIDWEERTENGRTVEARPPLRLAASYAVTAWTREVEDEHRLLSQVLAILYAYDTLPAELLAGDLADPLAQPFPLRTRVAEPRQSGSPEFWSSVGGSYKASLDFGVVLSCDAGATVERGPEVRSQTLRVRNLDGGRASVEDLHRVAGVVRDGEGAPVPDAWVVVAAGPGWTVADEAGRFAFDRMRAGEVEILARAPDGREGTATVAVPGAQADVVVGAAPPARASRKRR
jgi:hypothetical protein